MTAFAGLCGCAFDEPPHRVHREVVVYDQGPAVVEEPLVYDYTYYDRGYYNGPYWYYRDRDGHWYHEVREEHERRERERRMDNFHETHPPVGVDRRPGVHRDAGRGGNSHDAERGATSGHRDRD